MSEDDRPTALNSADPIRNFSLSVDERIRALTVGAPAYALRKRKIEDQEGYYVAKLVTLHEGLVDGGAPPLAVEAALMKMAAKFDLKKLNEWVLTHNRYYPIEANLPMEHRSGKYLVYGRVWEPEKEYTAERLVALAREAFARRREG